MATRSPLLRLGSSLVAATLLFGGTARAQDGAGKDTALEDARAHVGKAKVHYDLGEYEQAAEEYILVYRIKALPALLFNIAQAYRQAGKYEKAKQFYKSFLRESPDQKSKPVIEKAIKEIDELLAKDKRAREPAPTGTADAAPLSSPAPDRAGQKQAAAGQGAASQRQASTSAEVASAAREGSSEPRPVAARPAAVERVKAQPASTAASAEQKRAATVAVATAQPRAAAPAEVTQRSTAPAASSAAEEGTPLYKKWWLWTAVGVVAVGAGAAAVTMGGNAAPGSHFGTSKVFP